MTNTATDRIARLQAAIRPNSVAAVAVVPGADLHYLAGLDMHMNERVTVALFPSRGQPAIVLASLAAARAEATAVVPLSFYPWGDAEGPYGALKRCADALGVANQKIGVEYTAMRVLELRAVEQTAPGVRAEDATPI